MYTVNMLKEILDEYEIIIKKEQERIKNVGENNYNYYDVNKYLFAMADAGDILIKLIPDFKFSYEK